MSKSESIDESNSKKLQKLASGKLDNNVIDAELLSHQTNYQGGNDSQHVHHQHHQHHHPSTEDVSASATKAIEDLNKFRATGDLSHSFDYNQLYKASGAQQREVQAQREAQAQAIQARQAQVTGQVDTQNMNGPVNGQGSRSMVGTEEYHRVRKDNHKEVERRRRENINAGIKALASLLPNTESNKAQILQRAVEYIKRLKENETNNIEKWTLEKLLTDQAVAELSASNEKLKQELEKTYRELEHYKKITKEMKDKK